MSICGRVDRLVLALQQARGFGRDAAEHLALGVNHVPLPLDTAGSGNKRTHEIPFGLLADVSAFAFCAEA